MKKIFSLIAVAFMILPVSARSWEEVTNKVYIDVDSIEPYINDYDRQEQGKFVFWTKNLNNNSKSFKDWEKDYNKKIWYVLDKEIISCQQKTLSLKTLVIYDINNNVVDNIDIPSFALQPYSIVPDSVGELYYDGICK